MKLNLHSRTSGLSLLGALIIFACIVLIGILIFRILLRCVGVGFDFMGLIINPFEKTAAQKEQEVQDAKNRKIYESNPEVKRRADTLHHARMLPGDACDQCIAATINLMVREGVSFDAQEKENRDA